MAAQYPLLSLLILALIYCQFILAQEQTIVIDTPSGKLRGILGFDKKSSMASDLIAFRGVPYAQPPIGSLRWKPSVLLNAWSGVQDAMQFAPVCAQMDSGNVVGSEDCLHLNIYTRKSYLQNATSLNPIFVFVHGGGMLSGSSSTATTRLWTLSEQLESGAVSIGVEYRLNALGFFAHSLLTKESSMKSSGNLGVLDLVTALQWIQRNAKSFGGDPNRVVIWGQSSGATAVLMLVASPLARGLFSAAYSMSASPVIDAPLALAEAFVEEKFVKPSRCGSVVPDSAKLECLRSLKFQELVNATSSFENKYQGGYPKRGESWPPVAIVDGYLLRKPLVEALRDPSLRNDVPLVIGTVAQETEFMMPNSFENITCADYEKYLLDAEAHGYAWNTTTIRTILDMYPCKEYKSPALHFYSVSSDIRMACGTIGLVSSVAFAFTSPVYLYYLPQGPEFPLPFSSHILYYAFHCWDKYVLLRSELRYSYTKSDLALSDLLLASFGSLANKSALPSPWTPVNKTPSSKNSSYMVNIVQTRSKFVVEPAFKNEQCAFWHKLNFDKYTWANN